MPSQDNENAMDGLLRQSLARDSSIGHDCPDAELLAAYFDQSLGADEAAKYEIHFSTCPRCREQLAAMALACAEQILEPELALEPALAGTRPIALEAARTPAQAKPAASASRSEAKSSQRKSPGARWLDLRWLVPAAAMLVLGTFLFIRFASHTTTIGFNNQVAVSEPSAPTQDQTTNETETKLESNEPQKTSPPEAKQVPPRPPVAITKSSTSAATTSSAPPAHPLAPSAASGSAGGSGGSGAAPSFRGRPGGAFNGGHAAVSRPAMPGAARTLNGTNLSSAENGNAIRSNSETSQPLESNSAKRVARGQNSAARQNSAADQDAAAQDQTSAIEPAPAAPAPELNTALQKVPVSSATAEPVKSPAPAPPAAAEEKSKSAETTTKTRSLSGATAKSLGNIGARNHFSPILVYTADPNVIYRIARMGGLVEISSDGGNTWQGRLLDPPADINAHSAVAPKICWLVGSSGAVFVTEDGKTWRKLPPPVSGNLVEVEAKDAYRATVTSEDGQKWTTDDAGDIWYPAK